MFLLTIKNILHVRIFYQGINKHDSRFFCFWSLSPKNKKWNELDMCLQKSSHSLVWKFTHLYTTSQNQPDFALRFFCLKFLANNMSKMFWNRLNKYVFIKQIISDWKTISNHFLRLVNYRL